MLRYRLLGNVRVTSSLEFLWIQHTNIYPPRTFNESQVSNSALDSMWSFFYNHNNSNLALASVWFFFYNHNNKLIHLPNTPCVNKQDLTPFQTKKKHYSCWVVTEMERNVILYSSCRICVRFCRTSHARNCWQISLWRKENSDTNQDLQESWVDAQVSCRYLIMIEQKI